MAAQWYHGVCDRMLVKVAWWLQSWDQGYAHSTRQKINLKVEGGVEHVVVKRVVKVPFAADELSQLVCILKEAAPGHEMTRILSMAEPKFRNMKQLLNGVREVPLACYKVEVQEILNTLLFVRDGKPIGDEIENKINSGQSLW